MATEDVIELGSSDEESAEPAPKRRKMPMKAMVHIPDQLPSSLTVVPPKTFKPKINPASILKGSISSAVTVTKVSKNKIKPLATINHVDGSPASISVASKSIVRPKTSVQIPIQGSVFIPGKSVVSGSNVAVLNKPHIVASSSKTAVKFAVNNPNIVKQSKPQYSQEKPSKRRGIVKLPTATLNNTKLPPGITIKRTTPPSGKIGSKANTNLKGVSLKKIFRINPGVIAQVNSQKAIKGQSLISAEVPTVDLDDDEPATVSGHQWYLRPEQQEKNTAEDTDPLANKSDDSVADKSDDSLVDKLNDPKSDKTDDPLIEKSEEVLIENSHQSSEPDNVTKYEKNKSKKLKRKKSVEKSQRGSADKSASAMETCSLEKQNNEEPEKNNFIEITIEDSPLKPNHNKKGFQVGAELAITIDDSPVRNKSGKTVQSCHSDDENIKSSKEYNSKKKLEYPKIIEEAHVVEIEIEPLLVQETENNENNETENDTNKQPTTESTMEEKIISSSIETVKNKKSPKSDKEPSSIEKPSVLSNLEHKKEKPKAIADCMDIIEIEESPLKPIEEIKTTTPKKNKQSTPEYKITASNENNKTETYTNKQPTTKSTLEEKNSSSSIETVKNKKSPKSDNEPSSNERRSALSNSEHKKEKPKAIEDCMDIIEIEESPLKPIEEIKTTTPKKNKQSKPAYKIAQPIEIIDLDDKEKDEFTPMYRSFINLCFQLENSDDMNKIVEKKIKAYYRQVPKEYTESDSFTDLLAGKILAMKASPEKMYLYIKDVVDELNLQRKLAKAQPSKEKNEEQEKFLYGEESEFDAKRQRQIRKLEKTLKKLHRTIQKLEEQEVDFDDEEDSVYLLTERYKERSVRVHAKLCQLTKTKMPSEARVQIDPRPGQPKGPVTRLEKWINRKVPIGTPLPFPDFHDVLRCVREANKEDNIGWNEADIMEEGRNLFVRCGKKLQRRRQENEWRLAASRVPSDANDPAEESADLKRKLEENRRLASKKETEVFNKYADRQNLLKLEAVEIGDKEAEESPVESDDEVEEEVTNASSTSDSVTDKEKRKKRIKTLLQKSKLNKETDQKPDQYPVEKDNATEDFNVSEATDKKNTNEQELSEKDPISSNLSKEKGNDDSDAGDKSKSDNIGSDIDELHLLQRRDVQENSSSDTGSAIAIDDTTSSCEKSSDDMGPEKQSGDIISIENSSYSESEDKKGDLSEDAEKENLQSKINEELSDDIEPECITEIYKDTNTGGEEKRAYLEDILLASTDEDDSETSKNNPVDDTCINLRDDSISIGETMIVENREIDGSGEEFKADSNDKNTGSDGSSLEGMDIGFAETNSQDQRLECITENYSNESLGKQPDINATSEKLPADSHASPGNTNEIISLNSVESIEDDCDYETGIDIVKSVSDDKDKETIMESVESKESDTLVGKEEESSTKAIEKTTSSVIEITEITATDDANIVSDETMDQDNHIEINLKSDDTKEQDTSQHNQDTLKDNKNIMDTTDVAEKSTDDNPKKENLSVPSLDNTKETNVGPVESSESDTLLEKEEESSTKAIEKTLNTTSSVNEMTEIKTIDDANIVSDETMDQDNHIKSHLNSDDTKEQDISQHDQVTLKDKLNILDTTNIAEKNTDNNTKKENLSVPSLDNTKETNVQSVESIEHDTTVQNNGDTTSIQIESPMNDLKNINTDKINKTDETKENKNSVPEAMEVDSLETL